MQIPNAPNLPTRPSGKPDTVHPVMSPPVAAMDRRSSPSTAQSAQVECHPKQPLPVTPLPASRYQAVSCDARKVTHIIAYDCAPRPCGISPVTFSEPAHYGFEPTAEPSCPLGTDPFVQLVLRVPRYRLVPYLSTPNLRRVRGVCPRPTDRNRLGDIPVIGLVRRYRTNYLIGRAPPLSMAYARVTHSTDSRDTLFKSQTRGRSPAAALLATGQQLTGLCRMCQPVVCTNFCTIPEPNRSPGYANPYG